jgi:hypothetical protein
MIATVVSGMVAFLPVDAAILVEIAAFRYIVG